MFTGIIEATAKIQKIKASGFVLERPKIFDDLTIGSSIAVSGACLSVVSFDKKSMTFDVVPMTFSKTKLGSLTVGDSVNLERAMRVDGRFDGHIVTGHVEGVGKVVSLDGALSPDPSPATCALSPDPSPATGEGSVRERVFRGVAQLQYPPLTVLQHAKGMRKMPTPAEEKLWQALRRKQLNGLYFRRQRPIGTFIVDFYCEEKRLAIEVDGDYHSDPQLREFEDYRTQVLISRGVHVLRFKNHEIMNTFDEVLKKIVQFQLLSPPPSRGRGEGEGARERSETEIPGEGIREGADTRSAFETIEGLGVHDATGTLLSIDIPSSLTRFIVPHGSVTLDGVSLTVASFTKNHVTVALIPHTLEHTTLGSLQKGDPINIETDILGKYILSSSL